MMIVLLLFHALTPLDRSKEPGGLSVQSRTRGKQERLRRVNVKAKKKGEEEQTEMFFGSSSALNISHFGSLISMQIKLLL